MYVPAADALVKPHLKQESHLGRRQSNPKTLDISQRQFTERLNQWSEVEERLADMDKMDLDVQAVSCAPPQFHYEFERAFWCRRWSCWNSRDVAPAW